MTPGNPDADGFIRKKRRGRGECTVCGREFDSVDDARAHVDGLMEAGAFGDHMQIHAPEPSYGTGLPLTTPAREGDDEEGEEGGWRSRIWRFW